MAYWSDKLSDLQTVSLTACKIAPENARHASKGGFAELVTSIAAEGLLDPLHAYRDGKAVMVWDGGRRLRALKALAKGQRLPRRLHAGVPVLISDREAARRQSLVTFVRQHMHPAQEFRAYKALFDASQDPDQIAGSIGADARRVAQLLKLCNLAPEILDAFEAGAFGLDTAQAFALTDDQDKQRAALSASGDWINAGRVRQLLKAEMVLAFDRLALFIGRDAYVAAGGEILTDLFVSEQDAETWADKGLVERLAAEKLAGTVEALKAEGWGWVTVVDPYDYAWSAGFQRLPRTPAELTGEEQSAYDDAVAVLEMGEVEPEAAEAAEAVIAALDAKREDDAFDAEQRAGAGVFVQIDASGRLVIRRGYAKACPRGGDIVTPPGDPANDGWSHGSHYRLTHIATAAVRHALLEKPTAAYDILVGGLAWKLAAGTATASAMMLEPKGVSPASIPAEARLAGEAAWGERLSFWRDRLPAHSFQACFDYAVALHVHEKAEIVALAVGLSLDAIEPRSDSSRRSVWSQLRAFAEHVGLRVERAWTPDVSFVENGSKTALLAVLAETGDSGGFAKAKKPELVAAVLERAKSGAWMPKLLRELRDYGTEGTPSTRPESSKAAPE